MRSVIGFGLLSALFAIGCGGGGNLTGNTTDAGTNLDGHLGGGTTGNVGDTCATACDCQPGNACTNGQCGSGASSTYCCDSTTCPSGATCQATNGSFSTCATASTGVNGSNGGTSGSTGTIGGLGGGFPGLGDGGLGGLIGGLSGSSGGIIGGLGGSGDGGIIGGLTGGGTTGTSGYCSYIPCSSDGTCTQLGCTMCAASGMCQ